MQHRSRFTHWIAIVGLVVLGVLMAGCASQGAGEDTGKLQVTVSIVPQQYFVERIGGEYVTANVMVEPGASPATYEPKPEQLKALSASAAYFSIGVPFENAWLDKIADANEDMLLVDTAKGIERLPMAAHHHHEEDEHEAEHEHEGEHEAEHEHEGEHAHEAEHEHEHEEGALDPHIWTSPELVKIQAQHIYETLAALDAAHADDYKANLDAFIADIDALEANITETLAGVESRKFMVFHPSWGYFAADFGLEQIPIEVGGQEPSAQELAALIEHAQEEDIRVIFAQPEFSTADAETIAQEINGEVLLISPLAYDWLENLRRVAQTFADVLE